MIDGLTKTERKLKLLKLAYDEDDGYKKHQLKYRIINFEKKYFPKVFWEGKKGTYRKPKENK